MEKAFCLDTSREHKTCRVCFKHSLTYIHPIGLFDCEDSICVECLKIVRKKEHISGFPLCGICGECDIKLINCKSSRCSLFFCIGCLASNYGRKNLKLILRAAESKNWKCVKCSTTSPNCHLKKPDLEYRASLGGFTPRTYFPFSKENIYNKERTETKQNKKNKNSNNSKECVNNSLEGHKSNTDFESKKIVNENLLNKFNNVGEKYKKLNGNLCPLVKEDESLTLREKIIKIIDYKRKKESPKIDNSKDEDEKIKCKNEKTNGDCLEMEKTNVTNKSFNNVINVRKKPSNGPYNVISVVWFVKDGFFCDNVHPLRLKTNSSVTSYLLGLSKNIDALERHFSGWVMRIYYDHSVIAAYPEVAPHILKAFCKHPNVELFEFPVWPEFKNSNNTFVGLIPTIFRLLALEDRDINLLMVRDIDSLLSQNDFNKMHEFASSDKTVHRYFSKIYKWPMLTGGIAFNLGKKRYPIFENISMSIYQFLDSHFKNPDHLKPMIWERERVIRKIDFTPQELYPEEIGVYFLDQVFLEIKLFPEIPPNDIMTTQICIQGCHIENKKPKISKKVCDICHITTMEYYLSPTFKLSWMSSYNRKKLHLLKTHLLRAKWAKKYLFDQKIEWMQRDYIAPRKQNRPLKDFYKMPNLLERDDFSCTDERVLNESQFYSEPDDIPVTPKKIVKFDHRGTSIDNPITIDIEDDIDEPKSAREHTTKRVKHDITETSIKKETKSKDKCRKTTDSTKKTLSYSQIPANISQEEINQFLQKCQNRTTPRTRKYMLYKSLQFKLLKEPVVIELSD